MLHPYVIMLGGPMYKVSDHSQNTWEHKLPVEQLISVHKINTYVNKIIICSSNEIVLVNFVTGKVLYR